MLSNAQATRAHAYAPYQAIGFSQSAVAAARAGLANVRPGTLFCRIAGVINVHSYSPAGIVIELCLDLPNEHEERTMIVNSSGQIMVKTVHDHERVPEIGLA